MQTAETLLYKQRYATADSNWLPSIFRRFWPNVQEAATNTAADAKFLSLPVFTIFVLLSSCFTPIPAMAKDQKLESPSRIVKSAEHFVRNKLIGHYDDAKITIMPVDKRLRLTRCQRNFEFFFAQEKYLGNTSVGVRCPDYKPWTIYVPVSISAYDEIWVMKESLNRGNIISVDHIIKERRDLSRHPQGFITNVNEIIGMAARRRLRSGLVLRPVLLEKPKIIKRGDTVTILAKSKGLEVRMTGKALMNGADGQRIRVRNTLTRKIIHGVVTANGIIRVNL
ncbi:MAG: hypothetical protein BMS9Abin36_0512 [Gammaproteobacteria bacterium]|nr:MAG: hypothetical protein BMS9Abin36_0512 [Gammaproteobacteria bacterium]